MEHLVRFTTPEGREAFHVAPSLDDGLKFLEHLRNSQEATDARLYRLAEVPVSFRTYYKAELGTGAAEFAGATEEFAAR